ncbi:hypothetical protein GCM10023322_58910 [Rugosimonospora acidiphila]|uniref:Lipoprotein n=2 Tax=Rugosimonospora acidiphila TaxID=556531 RepID=A0ABP9SD69_9ACTN
MVTLAGCGAHAAKPSDAPTLAAGAYGTGEGLGVGVDDPSTAPSPAKSVAATGSSTAAPGATHAAAKVTSGTATGGGKATSTSGPTAAPIPRGQKEVVRYGVPISGYPALLDEAMAAGYRPVYLDGYDVGSAAYVNAVFRPADGVGWYQYIEMSASGYQSRFDSLKSQGYRLVSVESYLNGGQVRYAGLWSKSSGPASFAFHGYTATNYQTMLDKETAAGYLPANVSVVSVSGALSYTGLLVKRGLGSWELKSTLSPTDYNTLFKQELKAGLAPAYLNAYTQNGAVKFVALFASSPAVQFEEHSGLSATQAVSDTATEEKAGYLTSSAAGYDDGGQTHFIVCWSH